jgi:predicted Fe-Mo cluster-binding NifX family protein
MKACITATGTGLESEVDPRFGRAAHLLLVDLETRALREIEQATGASHGAGVQAAQAVVRARAEAVVTGRIGPRAFEVLDAAGIPVYLTTAPTVTEAIRQLAGNRLERIPGPTAPLHSGTGA